MSDDILSVIPADPTWQPDPAAADRTEVIVAELAPGVPDGVDVEIEVTWYDTITLISCGENLEKIGCPHCGGSIDTEWWAELIDGRGEDGFETLAVEVPCCGAATSLDTLDYDWPCGFARFEIAVWNPERAWFGDEELERLGAALGHPVRQVRAHI